MKLRAYDEVEQDSIGVDETIDSTIDTGNFAFIFDMVTRQFYSNPKGSIIREITSNCYDANVESKSQEPVIITMGYDIDQGKYYIKFEDNGIGLNPYRINNIYRKWFTSTKRDTNDQIGGFGIGSKSPLAYANEFFITTVYEEPKFISKLTSKKIGKYRKLFTQKIPAGTHNIEDQYMMHKGTANMPVELLFRKKTDRKTGTCIHIDIANDVDSRQFVEESHKQLAYFDTVYIHDIKKRFNNNYQIVKKKTFKYRGGAFSQFHIVINNVYYPIDIYKFDVSNYPPVGLYFDIGELTVTPNRENLVYNDETVAKINERLTEFNAEIHEIFNSQTSLEIDDFDDYYIRRNESTYIKVNGDSLNVSSIVTKPKYIWKPIGYSINPNMLADLFQVFRLRDAKIKTVFHNFYRPTYSYVYAEELDTYNNNYHLNADVVIPRTLSYHQLCLALEIPEKMIGKALLIKRVTDHILEYVKNKTGVYDKATEEWKAKFRREQREKLASRVEKIRAYQLGSNDDMNLIDKTIEYFEGQNHNVIANKKIKTVINRTLFIIYSFHSKDYARLELSSAKQLMSKWSGTKRVLFLQLNQTNYNKLRKHKIQMYNADALFGISVLQNYFQKVAIANKFDGVNYYVRKDLQDLSQYYNNLHNDLEKFSNKYAILNNRKMYHIGVSYEMPIDKKYFSELLAKFEKWSNFKKHLGMLEWFSSNAPKWFKKQSLVPVIKQIVKQNKLIKISEFNNDFIQTNRTEYHHND